MGLLSEKPQMPMNKQTLESCYCYCLVAKSCPTLLQLHGL